MDVDSGIETMEVDDVETRQDVKRRRVGHCFLIIMSPIKLEETYRFCPRCLFVPLSSLEFVFAL